MAIIHIFKDGTTTTELKDVYVPKEIVERVAAIANRDRKKEERNEKDGK